MPYQKTPFTRVPTLDSIPNLSRAVLKSMVWNTNNLLRITIFGSNMRTALHAWVALNTHMFTAHFICGPKCPALFVIRYILWNNVQEENLELFWSERSKPSTKKRKLKINSHARKDHEKKLMLNFLIQNLAIFRWNSWMITKLHKNCSQKQAKYFSPKCVDDNWHWRP